MFSPSLRSFEYSVLITTEASKLKKWYSDQPLNKDILSKDKNNKNVQAQCISHCTFFYVSYIEDTQFKSNILY